MKRPSVMLITGEPSGDQLAAEVVRELRPRLIEQRLKPTPDAQPLRTGLAPEFFGAGGPRMASEGVDLVYDLTAHSSLGISDVLRNYLLYRRRFRALFKRAIREEPDLVVGVDSSSFNLRFASALRRYARNRHGSFNNWSPKFAQLVSPQVWASRPQRAFQMQENLDLLLAIFPFERDWYAKRVPNLPVKFVGHPILDRYPKDQPSGAQVGSKDPIVLLLPGSRPGELRHHLPVLLEAFSLLQSDHPRLRAEMVVPTQRLAEQARQMGVPPDVSLSSGDLPTAVQRATVAITKTGTVTMECAYFGLPAVTFYKSTWVNVAIARMIVTGIWTLTMPNLLAGEAVYPEFLQEEATARNLAREANKLLSDHSARMSVQAKLRQVIASLGEPGAAHRAAEALATLLQPG